MINSLAVFLQHRRIGVIHRLVDDRYRFVFEQDYVDQPQRPILSLSFKDQAGKVDAGVSSRRRLPPFFSNLLPEGDLLLHLARQIGIEPSREFFLLAALGADLPGALTVTPLDADDSARDYINNLAPRFSLAGVQLKFSALDTSGVLAIPADGIGGGWIIKLSATHFPALAENEYVSLELARAVGITVPRTRLVDVANIRGLPIDLAQMKKNALAIERFDRGPGGELIHAEDFCQVFGLFPHDKYHYKSYANIALSCLQRQEKLPCSNLYGV